jgi:hypothetical protein
MEQITIHVNWANEDSIRLAERAKLELENKGYTLINQFGGLFHSALVYRRPPSINSEEQ